MSGRFCRLPVLFLLLVPAVLASASLALAAAPWEAHLPRMAEYKLQGHEPGPTLLVVGGIQGDEPGGFSAASLLATRYSIKRGNVWVVPNLNFASIISNSRGLYGDMNRKFAVLSPSDPEYATVKAIQEMILDPQVDLILNLHDGSGFYRPKHENALRNPRRWGQCIVIDQEAVDADIAKNHAFMHLEKLGERVAARVNGQLLDKNHTYHIKNTTTRNFDHEMEKTLSYFAVCAGKAAFGLEASKELNPQERIYYHAQLLEAFMHEMGIEFERSFDLSPHGVSAALNADILLSMYGNRTIIPLANPRPVTAGVIPMRKDDNTVKWQREAPLLVALPDKAQWRVVFGNRTLTRFRPEYLDFDDSLAYLSVEIDGVRKDVPIGATIHVRDRFIVEKRNGYRVNAIGATREVDGSECGVPLSKADFQERFSLDRDGMIYRVEVYTGNAYCGMFLVNFSDRSGNDPQKEDTPLTAERHTPDNGLGR